MPWARVVGGVGRVLVTAGVLVLLFVAYQLWGTGLAEAQAQDDLRSAFEASLDDPTTGAQTTEPTTTSTTTTATTTTTVAGEPSDPTTTSTSPTVTTPTTAAPPTTRPPAPQGEAIAIIRIPRIDVDKAVVEGVTVGDLKKGPGHYPGSPLPGRPGNAAIAGHRTTYGAPFGSLGSLTEGDEILVTTREGDFRYLVDRISIVSPSQVEVLDASDEARITLTTCHPKYSARQRLVVSGVLSGEPATPPAADPTPAPTNEPGAPTDPADPVEEPGDPTDPADPAEEPSDPAEEPSDPAEPAVPSDEPEGPAAPADEPVVEQAPLTIDDPSLAGDPSARAPAAGWGAATALIALGAWLVGGRWRRWPSYVLALPLGAVTLFLCFEQISRLLPSNI